MIRTPTGLMAEADALALFEQVGFSPPPGTSTQDAFLMLLDIAREQQAQEAAKRPGRGRTAVLPEPRTADAAVAVLLEHDIQCTPISPCGCEITGLDLTKNDGELDAAIALGLEVELVAKDAAHHEVLRRVACVKLPPRARAA